jgi:hypothetical protein
MTTKRFVLATTMMMLVAMSGQALAGATISDKRYWPGELGATHQNTIQRPENAFGSAEPPQETEPADQPYQGGPKGNY